MIFLCSFKYYAENKDKIPANRAWSAAMWQPRGYDLPTASCWLIADDYGRWKRPRDFLDKEEPHLAYSESLFLQYQSRKNEIRRWLYGVGKRDVYLCCWCPYDKAGQRQLRDFGSFCCHLAIVAAYLSFIKVPHKFLDHQETRFEFIEHLKSVGLFKDYNAGRL